MSSSFVTPWTVARQAPLFMGFPRQDYWSELLSPTPGDLPDLVIKPCLLHWQADSLLLHHLGSPQTLINVGYPLHRHLTLALAWTGTEV